MSTYSYGEYSYTDDEEEERLELSRLKNQTMNNV